MLRCKDTLSDFPSSNSVRLLESTLNLCSVCASRESSISKYNDHRRRRNLNCSQFHVEMQSENGTSVPVKRLNVSFVHHSLGPSNLKIKISCRLTIIQFYISSDKKKLFLRNEVTMPPTLKASIKFRNCLRIRRIQR